jgi:hypothetical protein
MPNYITKFLTIVAKEETTLMELEAPSMQEAIEEATLLSMGFDGNSTTIVSVVQTDVKNNPPAANVTDDYVPWGLLRHDLPDDDDADDDDDYSCGECACEEEDTVYFSTSEEEGSYVPYNQRYGITSGFVACSELTDIVSTPKPIILDNETDDGYAPYSQLKLTVE